MKTLRMLVILAAAVSGAWVLSTGCSDNADETVTPELKRAGEVCTASAECQSGLECLDGLCATPAGSRPPPERRPAGGACETNENCQDGLECRDRVCATPVPPPTPSSVGGPCSATQSCATGLVCRGTMCGPQGAALDTTFGGDGIVTVDFNSVPSSTSQDIARAVLIQPDGKIVAVGEEYEPNPGSPPPRSVFAVARFNSDGSPDNSFDGDGKTTTSIATGRSVANAAALQSDGKIVVAGVADGTFALVRYNPNGSLDNTFDGDGKLTTEFDLESAALAVAIQPDGKIVAAGYAFYDSRYKFALARYNSNDGSLDTSFDSDGRIVNGMEDGYTAIKTIVLHDGKIIAAGTSDRKLAIARYMGDGTLDVSFGGDGKVFREHSDTDEARAVQVQADGKIVTAGGVYGGTPSDAREYVFAISRLLSDGRFDPTFGTSGLVTTLVGDASDFATSLLIQPDGKLIAGGYSLPNGGTMLAARAALVRYVPADGNLDRDFGNNGKLIINSSGPIMAIAQQPDGRIVAAGYSGVSGTTRAVFTILRIWP